MAQTETQKRARRQLLQNIKTIRKTYYEEWRQAEQVRQQAREAVLARQSQQRVARIQKRTAEHQAWLKEFEHREAERKRVKAQIAADTWKRTAANNEIRRSVRAKTIVAPLKESLAHLIDSTNLAQRITPQLVLQRSKLRGLPDIDICHQDELLMKYLCDPLDPHLVHFQKEYLPASTGMFSQLSRDFVKSNNSSAAAK